MTEPVEEARKTYTTRFARIADKQTVRRRRVSASNGYPRIHQATGSAIQTKLACGKATRRTSKPNTWQRRQHFRCSVVRGVVAYDESVDAKFAGMVEHGRKTQCFVPHLQNGEHVIACDWRPRTKQLKVRHTVPHGFHGGMTLPFGDGGDPSVLLLAVLG
jgi:hypothetical protein